MEEYQKHHIMGLADKVKLLGDLEHTRSHCVRSAHVAETDDEKFYYQVKSEQAKRIRREVQAKWLNAPEKDWCLVKTSARLKWLNEEVLSDDLETFSKIEDLADDLLSHALNEDLSGCASCRDDVQSD